MRFVIRFFLIGALLLALLPALISSLLVDWRGIIITGRVASKEEYIVSHYNSWRRSLDVTIQYDPPDAPGVAFLTAELAPDRFDSLKKGDLVPVRYLRMQDLPTFPGVKPIRQMHLLLSARLAGTNTWSGLGAGIAAHRLAAGVFFAVFLFLLPWWLLRIPYLGWAVSALVVVALLGSYFADMPEAMPPPRKDVRTAAGVVKSLDRCDRLFRDIHHGGVDADQPIQIAGVKFVPGGRTEPVVAVDLIDEGSLPGLRENAPVTVRYEAAAPRVAYISGATRHFFGRNLRGLVTQGFAMLVVTLVLLAAYILLRALFRNLTRSRV